MSNLNSFPRDLFDPPAPVRPDWAELSSRARARLARWWVCEVWRPWYLYYLSSPLWARRREAILSRAEHRCEMCGERAAYAVHHRTYARVGQEQPGDLVAVCDGCHAKVHGHER